MDLNPKVADAADDTLKMKLKDIEATEKSETKKLGSDPSEKMKQKMTSLVEDEPEPENQKEKDKDSEPETPEQMVEEDEVPWDQFSHDIFELQNKVRRDPRWFTIHLKK